MSEVEVNDRMVFDTILIESSVNDEYMIKRQREWNHKPPTWIQHLIFFSIFLLSTIILVSAGHVRLMDIFKGPSLRRYFVLHMIMVP
jgi:hypothetical protein